MNIKAHLIVLGVLGFIGGAIYLGLTHTVMFFYGCAVGLAIMLYVAIYNAIEDAIKHYKENNRRS